MITQADHDAARRAHNRAIYDAATDYDPERHDEGAGAVAWGCLSVVGWIAIGLVWLVVKGMWR